MEMLSPAAEKSSKPVGPVSPFDTLPIQHQILNGCPYDRSHAPTVELGNFHGH